jgi:hypothetical protein
VFVTHAEGEEGFEMAEVKRTRGAEGSVRLEAKCTWCGPVVVQRDGVWVFVSERGAGLFVFLCPDCRRENYRSITISDLEALALAGILPAEGRAPFELLEDRSGPPIGWDDLIDFHQAIRGNGRAWNVPSIEAASGPRALERDAA